MKKDIFLSGSALFALARRRAHGLQIDTADLKLAELIKEIQQQEGNTACFRSRKSCPEFTCCWQKSCGAQIGQR